MTAHVFCRRSMKNNGYTLSNRVVSGLLREELRLEVILSDDRDEDRQHHAVLAAAVRPSRRDAMGC
jgi:hypothetical protein